LQDETHDVIDNSNIRDGDMIVGLASYGKAKYERDITAESGATVDFCKT
jgi:phosphoribosylformylglycinamidine cyclo-ligase